MLTSSSPAYVAGFGGHVADAPGLGWRSAFVACGAFGMLYAIPLVLLLRDVPRGDEEAGSPATSPARAAPTSERSGP